MSAASDITNLFLYGQSSTPANKVDDNLIRPTSVTEPVFNVNVNTFMTSGGGRFALGAQFDFIQDFFTEPVSRFTSNPNFHYGQAMSKEFVAETIFGLAAYGWDMKQYNFSDGSDYAERVYIYNSMEFKVVDGAQFIIEANGSRRIENFAVIPRDDAQVPENFDFVGDGYIAKLGNPTLAAAIDPSKIGRTVDIDFTGSVGTSTYDSQDFINDNALKNSFGSFHSATLNAGIADIAENLWNSGVTKFLASGNKPIVYGTIGGDNLDESDIQGSSWADLNGVPTIDDSQYANNGTVLIGGAGGDMLTGGAHADSLLGGADADSLDGGDGSDVLWCGDGAVQSSGAYTAAAYGKDDLVGDSLVGGAGNDVIYAGQGDTVDGGNDNDVIYAVNAATILGGAGNDTIYAYYTTTDLTGVSIDGGGGDDRIYLLTPAVAPADYIAVTPGDGNNTVVVGGDGIVVNYPAQYSGTYIVQPGAHVSLYGGAPSAHEPNNHLFVGNQSLSGLVLTRILGGGESIGGGYFAGEFDDVEYVYDHIYSSSQQTSIYLNYGGMADFNITYVAYPAEDEQVHNPISTPSPYADSYTQELNNLIASYAAGGSGTPGDDAFDGGAHAGNDTYDGGLGIDRISYAATTQGVNVHLGAGQATGSEIGVDTLRNIENARGGAGNDTIELSNQQTYGLFSGDEGNDYIDIAYYGGVRNNTVYGGAGNDTLRSYQGDTITGFLQGQDKLDVGVLGVTGIQAGVDCGM